MTHLSDTGARLGAMHRTFLLPPLPTSLRLAAGVALALACAVASAAGPAKPKPPASDGTARAMCKSALVAKSYGDSWAYHNVVVESTKTGKTVTGKLVKGRKSFEYTCHTNITGKVIDLTIGDMVTAK